MSEYIPDYADLHTEYEHDQEGRLSKYPECDCCGEAITDEHFYNIDGTFICETCLKEEYRKNTEDYMED